MTIASIPASATQERPTRIAIPYPNLLSTLPPHWGTKSTALPDQTTSILPQGASAAEPAFIRTAYPTSAHLSSMKQNLKRTRQAPDSMGKALRNVSRRS
jgi:hypothetical protein